jgi:hypothetical protein
VASAQERAPHAGSTAVGVDVGAFGPNADQLDNALIFSVLLEYYLTPRVSVRTDFGLTDPGFGAESSDSLRQIPLRVDLNYNWERGKWHPFAGAVSRTRRYAVRARSIRAGADGWIEEVLIIARHAPISGV